MWMGDPSWQGVLVPMFLHSLENPGGSSWPLGIILDCLGEFWLGKAFPWSPENSGSLSFASWYTFRLNRSRNPNIKDYMHDSDCSEIIYVVFKSRYTYVLKIKTQPPKVKDVLQSQMVVIILDQNVSNLVQNHFQDHQIDKQCLKLYVQKIPLNARDGIELSGNIRNSIFQWLRLFLPLFHRGEKIEIDKTHEHENKTEI